LRQNQDIPRPLLEVAANIEQLPEGNLAKIPYRQQLSR
jgi:hypothetical protein